MWGALRSLMASPAPDPLPAHHIPPARHAIPTRSPGAAGLLPEGPLENTEVSHPKPRLSFRVEKIENAKSVAACP